MKKLFLIAVTIAWCALNARADDAIILPIQRCDSTALQKVGGVQNAWLITGGGIAAFSKMNINLDGYGRA